MKTKKFLPFKWADTTYKIEIDPYIENYIENGWEMTDFKIDMSLHYISGKQSKKIYAPCYKHVLKEDRKFFLDWCINDLVQEVYRHSSEVLSKDMRKITMSSLDKAITKWYQEAKID